MSSHAVAIGLSAFAYAAARLYARDPRFAFGTWKIEVLAGFASAIFLLGVAALMIVSSAQRIFSPQPIQYREAIVVAVLGLLVNIVCAMILGKALTLNTSPTLCAVTIKQSKTPSVSIAISVSARLGQAILRSRPTCGLGILERSSVRMHMRMSETRLCQRLNACRVCSAWCRIGQRTSKAPGAPSMRDQKQLLKSRVSEMPGRSRSIASSQLKPFMSRTGALARPSRHALL